MSGKRMAEAPGMGFDFQEKKLHPKSSSLRLSL